MNLYALPNLLVSVYTLLLGIFVFSANPGGGKNQALMAADFVLMDGCTTERLV
jgi:hypothetical protein